MQEAKIEERVCDDKISELPDDLLVTILSLVPTKDAVATMFLSKRWLSIWTMVPVLTYKDTKFEKESKNSLWFFIDKSLQYHKAPVVDILCVKLGSQCPTDIDVGKCVANAVDRCVLMIKFKLLWSADPTRLPNSLYSCKSLVSLTLSHKILVDFPSSSCLPSLKKLKLHYVVYEDDDSLHMFLSSCPVLNFLYVKRKKDDNLKTFTVKVPSLRGLFYYYSLRNNDVGDTDRFLVIDTPALEELYIIDSSRDYFSIYHMPLLVKAHLIADSYLEDRLLRSLSSVLSLELFLNDKTLVCCSTIKFSRLIKLTIHPEKSDWSEPLMLLLENAPKLRDLMVDYEHRDQSENFPLSWSQPNSVPGCLSSQLEIFEWREYEYGEEDGEILTYILAHSKRLKTATISLRPSFDLEEQALIIQDLKDIPRVSTASQLLFR